ncbi:hypothetical protein C1645_737868 [Glomus cerebriforme]|uniref:Uncharacterized protein n=1 Tax=Glomus cerebriforme TaxID=658196 RepID=A0A397T603_9GLOM|nr:hypothetical protein C1645_737868 [Glomus cerebriforme]
MDKNKRIITESYKEIIIESEKEKLQEKLERMLEKVEKVVEIIKVSKKIKTEERNDEMLTGLYSKLLRKTEIVSIEKCYQLGKKFAEEINSSKFEWGMTREQICKRIERVTGEPKREIKSASLTSVLALGNWSSNSTYQKFYQRGIKLMLERNQTY